MMSNHIFSRVKIYFGKRIMFYVFMFLCSFSSAFAQPSSSSSSFDFSSSPKLFFFSADLKIGLGTEVSDDTTSIASRDMASYAAEVSTGVRLYHMIFGASGEYALIKQLTDPSEVSNSNTQGKLKAISPLLGLELGIFRLLFKLPTTVYCEYALDQKNSRDQQAIYKDANVFGGQLQWMTTESSFWGIGYQKMTFRKLSTAGADKTLSNSAYLNLTTISLFYGFSY